MLKLNVMELKLKYMEALVNKKIAVLLLALISIFAVKGQTLDPPLERVLSITLEGNSIQETLLTMQENGGFQFGYRSFIIDEEVRLNRVYLNKSTREILEDVFQGKIAYSEKGNYIILKEKVIPKTGYSNFEGYVLDTKTGLKVPYVSIFDPESLSSAISDEYGHFSFSIKESTNTKLHVRKKGYVDTILSAPDNSAPLLYISLRSENVEQSVVLKDTTPILNRFEIIKPFGLKRKTLEGIKNMEMSLHKKAQFTLISPIGTNKKLDRYTKSNYSFNLIGGFNGGVKYLELGGLYNIVWDTASYFQFAGGMNLVGGVQRGVQIAGITNLNSSKFSGIQLASVFNRTDGNFNGIQVAGIYNLTNGKFRGVQASLVINKVDAGFIGVQGAGIANFSSTNLSGIQAAGIYNSSKGRLNGVQVAGFRNHAEKINGLQIAGFYNYASRVNGVQIGLVNVSDTIKGVPIGLLSFSKTGLHQLELTYKAGNVLGFAFRTGTNQFYNILDFGLHFRKKSPLHTHYMYGVGTSV
ncbi:MAG: hypothetical protein ACSHXL_06735, partial [Bacteroidota bacterium]